MEPLLGMIKLFPYGFVPYGWALCNGATLNIANNQALYSLIGIKFGGDGRTTFNLPNLTTAVPETVTGSKMGYYIATMGIYPSRP